MSQRSASSRKIARPLFVQRPRGCRVTLIASNPLSDASSDSGEGGTFTTAKFSILEPPIRRRRVARQKITSRHTANETRKCPTFANNTEKDCEKSGTQTRESALVTE